MDWRSLPFALAALAVWAFWAGVVPAVNGLVPWDDPIQPGDRIRVSGHVTFQPAVGWNLESGLRTTDHTAGGETSTEDVVLVRDGVRFRIVPGPWRGTPGALLGQLARVGGHDLTGRGQPVVTSAGAGVIEPFRGARAEGVVAAFAGGGLGLEVDAEGPPGQFAAHAQDVERMIASLR